MVEAWAGEEGHGWAEKAGVAAKVVAMATVVSVAREARASGSAKKVGATMDNSCRRLVVVNIRGEFSCKSLGQVPLVISDVFVTSVGFGKSHLSKIPGQGLSQLLQ